MFCDRGDTVIRLERMAAAHVGRGDRFVDKVP
jgi:hypothetical protein